MSKIDKFTDTTDDDLEKAVLGAILLEEEAYDNVSSDLKPYCFENVKHQYIFKAIVDIKLNNGKVDLYSVAKQLQNDGLFESIGKEGEYNGGYYIASLTNKIATAANIEYHARLIIQKYLKRKLQNIASETIIKLNDRGVDPFDIFDDIKHQLDASVNDVSGNKSFDTIESLVSPFLQEIHDRMTGLIPPGIPVGLTALHEYGGDNDSDLIIVGARPGMGKTAYMIKGVRTCVIDLKKPCGFFSLEMKSLQLLLRIASAECKINGEDIRKGKINNAQLNELHKRMNEIKSLPLYIDDTGGIDIERLCSKARIMKKRYGIKKLYIDYLQLITTTRYPNDKTRAVGHISGKLKQLAKELDIPVIAGSQLSRKIEERPIYSRNPMLSDLRESGDIEQDADQVILLFRPEYYGVEFFSFDKDGNNQDDVRGKVYIDYAKNRHGALGMELVGFNKYYTEFHDLPHQIKAEETPLQPLQNNNDFLSINDIEETFR